jgi:hypothetical protein
MRRSGEDAINAGEQKAGRRSRRVADGGANSRWLGISQSRQCRGLSRRRRLGSRHGKETKGASSGSRVIPEAAIALLRQAATCDKPLTSLLRRRERSASQDVVGQRAGWVSEHTLGQDMSLTHAARHHRFTLAVPHRLLPLDTSPVTGSVFFGPVLAQHVDCRLPTVACRLPLADALSSRGPWPRPRYVPYVPYVPNRPSPRQDQAMRAACMRTSRQGPGNTTYLGSRVPGRTQ